MKAVITKNNERKLINNQMFYVVNKTYNEHDEKTFFIELVSVEEILIDTDKTVSFKCSDFEKVKMYRTFEGLHLNLSEAEKHLAKLENKQ